MYLTSVIPQTEVCGNDIAANLTSPQGLMKLTLRDCLYEHVLSNESILSTF